MWVVHKRDEGSFCLSREETLRDVTHGERFLPVWLIPSGRQMEGACLRSPGGGCAGAEHRTCSQWPLTLSLPLVLLAHRPHPAQLSSFLCKAGLAAVVWVCAVRTSRLWCSGGCRCRLVSSNPGSTIYSSGSSKLPDFHGSVFPTHETWLIVTAVRISAYKEL